MGIFKKLHINCVLIIVDTWICADLHATHVDLYFQAEKGDLMNYVSGKSVEMKQKVGHLREQNSKLRAKYLALLDR